MIKLQGRSRIMAKDEDILVLRHDTIYVDGAPVAGPETERHIKANVQPLNGRDLLLVPEGDRFKEQYYLFTHDVLSRTTDRVYRDGVNFEIQSIEQWGSFFRIRIMRIDVGVHATP